MQDNRDDLYLNLRDAGIGEDVIGTQKEFKDFVTNEQNTRDLYNNLRDSGIGEDIIGSEDDFYNFVAPDFSSQKDKAANTNSTQQKPFTQQEYDNLSTVAQDVAKGVGVAPKFDTQGTAQKIKEQLGGTKERTQYVPKASNVATATPTEETLKKYPFLKADEAVLFNRETGEPFYTWVDENGKPLSQRDIDIRTAKQEITGEREYMQKAPASLELPDGQVTAIRLDGSLTDYVDNMMKQQYGDDYLGKRFTDKDGKERSGEELRNSLAQETYDKLNEDVKNARIALFEVEGDKDKEAEINTAMVNKWKGIMSGKRMLDTLHDENAMKQDVKDYAQNEIDKAREEERRIIEEMNKRGAELDAASSPYVDQTFNTRQVDSRYTLLTTELNAVRDRIRSWEAVRDSDDYGAMRALKDTAGNLRSWDLGYSELVKGMHLVFGNDSDKKELVNLLGDANRAKNFEQKAISDYARYVQIAGQSLPFAAQFMATGGGYSGVSKGIARQATKWAERKALQGFKKAAVKYLGVAAGDVVAGYTLAGTLQGMGTLGDIMQRKAGDIVYNAKKGEYELVIPKSWIGAAYKGATAAMIENTSELLGEHLHLGRAAMKLLPKAGLKQVSDWLTKAGKSELYTTTRQWLQRAGINGLGGEIIEEEIAIPLNAVLVGDNPLLFGEGGLLDAKTQMDIVGGISLSVFAMNAATTAIYGSGQALSAMFDKDQRRLDNADTAAIEIIGGQKWTEIKNKIDNATNEELADVASEIGNDKDLNDEQKKVAADYITSTLKMRGHNLGENAAMQVKEQRNSELDSMLSPEEQQNVHDDGMIHSAILYPITENGGNAEQVFIVKGNVALNNDGKIDVKKSSDTVYYRGSDGQIHMIPPDKIQAADVPVSVEDYIASKNNTSSNVNQEPSQQVVQYSVGDEVNIDVNGQSMQGEVAGTTEDGNYIVSYENEDGTMSSVRMSPEELAGYNQATDASQQMPEVPTSTNAPQSIEQPVEAQQPAQAVEPVQPVESNTEQVQPANAEGTAQVQQEQSAQQSIPTDEEGNPLYYNAPIEATINDLYDGSLNDEEIQGFIDANIQDAQKKYDSIQKKAPKIGTNKAKYLEQKREWQTNVDEAKRILDYWQSVDNYRKEQTHTTDADIQSAQAELSGDNARAEFDEYNDNGGVNNAVSVASDFIRGAKITPDSFKAEKGYGTSEQQKFVGMIAKEENGGKTIDRLAEELVSYDNSELNGVTYRGDTSLAKDAILEALQAAGTRGELAQNNTAEREKYVEARMADLDAQYMEAYGMTYDEYLSYEEQIMPTIWRDYNNYDEIAFNNMYAEEIQQLLNTRENGNTTGEKQTDDRGNQVLSEQQSIEQPGSAGSTEPGTEIQAGVQSNNENAAPQEEQPTVAQNEGNTLANEAHELFSDIIAQSTHNVEINDSGISETDNTLYAPIKVDGKDTSLSLYQEEPAHSSEEPVVGVSFYRDGMTYQEAADLSDAYNQYVGEKVCTDGSDELAINFGSIDEAVRFEEWLNDNGGVLFREAEDDSTHKQRQLEIINDTNPMLDDYHTGIRSEDDIKTMREAIEEARSEAEKYGDETWSAYPDITNEMLDEALRSGKITVYSSKPIVNGNFVTPSRMQASDYAGGGRIYSKTVNIDDVAWINTDEGQYANTDNDANENIRFRFIGEQGAANLDAAEEATTRLDNLATARRMEQAYIDKKARIDKLRDSKPVEITGEEYKGKYDLNRDSAQDFILKNLRGEYTIADTGEKVTISKVGAKKVTSHSMGNNAHLKSIVAIPQLLKNAIFIEEVPNEKENGKYDSYRYYVTGLKIGNEDYTVRLTIGVKNGKYYYDHYLTEIEKGNLIEIANGFTPTGDAPVPSYTNSKDTRLISLLQTNDRENARKIKIATGWERGADGKWRYETRDFEYNPPKKIEENKEYKLRDFIKDDELFKAYPELEKIKVFFNHIPESNYGGYYVRGEIVINTANSRPWYYKSILAHEMQHAIQGNERFASGGTTEDSLDIVIENGSNLGDFSPRQLHDLYFIRKDAERLIEDGKYKRMHYAIRAAIKDARANNLYPDWADAYDQKDDTYVTVFDALSLFNADELNRASVTDRDDLYRRIGGEVEARNVQTRLDLPLEERRRMLAEETEDVAREDQIFLEKAFQNNRSEASALQVDDIDTAVADTANKLNIGVRVAHSVDEVSDEGVRRAIEKGRNVKGWYDTRTGEIVVYAPNATDADDSVRTVLHEGVAHYGLRQLVGDENFDTFLDNIYNNVDEGIKAAIDEKAQRHGWSTRVATEEYLASLAEDTNFEAARSSGLWQRIKDFFMDLLTKAGIRLNNALSDNELRYILWRSYDNLQNPTRDVINTVRDITKQRDLNVGNYAVQNTSEDTDEADGVRYREVDDELPSQSRNKFREQYEEGIKGRIATLNRAYFDSMQPMKKLQEAIEKETSQPIQPEENVYLQENRAMSIANRKYEIWERSHMEPVREAVVKLMKDIRKGNFLSDVLKRTNTKRNAYNAVVQYMKSKHGLENNEYRRNMEAEAAREPFEAEIGAVEKLVKDGNISRAEADKRQAKLKEQADKAEAESRKSTKDKDYSGLQGIYGKDFEQKAKDYVGAFEESFKTDDFWKTWNGATKAILEEEYKSGLLSKELYDKIRGMYKYYIPLKGWAENRAEDVYTYYTTGSGDGGRMQRRKGRTSESDDPLVTLEQDADRQFNAAARNNVKRALYNLATTHKSDLLTVRRQWYQNMGTKENPDWQRVDAEIPENATPEEMEKIVSDFEKNMRELAKDGMAMRQKRPMILPYHATKRMEKEHTVKVMVNGKEYVIYVNGNPAAAQAVNGTSTPKDADNKFLENFVLRPLRWFNRTRAALLTAWNFNFIPSNLARDAQYSIQNMKAKEPATYVMRYVKNLSEGMAKMTSARLFYKDKKGTLDMNDPTERLFKEFLDNGGETGYSKTMTLEQRRRSNMSAINKLSGIDWTKGARLFFDTLAYANRSIETIVRFAAYKTSRESGRSIVQSINDAKEASVNFDKHGSGEYGNKEWRLLYIFANVKFQSMRRMLENATGHPVRFTLAQAERFALGFAVPMLAKFILDSFGDDDEKDAYDALPEWMRQSGLTIPISPIVPGVPKRTFLYLPFGPEDKVWYALGEMSYHEFNSDEPNENMAKEFASLVADLLPVDVKGYGGNMVVNLAPTAVQDIVALEQNVNYWGQPIYRETMPYNENEPGQNLAFAGTPEWFVKRAEDINRLTGGNDYSKGAFSPKPEQIEYIINQTGGGVTRVVSQIMGLVERAGEDGNKDIPALKNTPVLSSFVKQAEEKEGGKGFDREAYYKYINEYEKAIHDLKAYTKGMKKGDDEASRLAEELKKSPAGERMDTIRNNIGKIRARDKAIRKLNEIEKPTPKQEMQLEELKKESNEMKNELVDKLDDITEKRGE